MRPTRIARLAAFAGAGATFLLSGVVFAGSATAHHPEIDAAWSCDGTVTYTARAWAGTTPEARTNPTIDVAWTEDQAADFRRIPADAFTDLPSGSFGAADGFEFSGSFVPATTADSIGLLVTEAADWANGTPRRGPGQEDDSQFVRVSRPTDCPPPVDECADTVPAVEAVTLDATGGTATAGFTVTGCGEVGLTLRSSSDGALFATGTGSFAAGAGSLAVALPPCTYEVELLAGDAVLAETSGGSPCARTEPATAVVADPTCLDGGAIVTLRNPGLAPVTFTVAGTPTTVAAGATEHVVVPVGAAPTEVRISAPGMQDVVRTLSQDCTAPAARPSAVIGDAMCSEEGALVELANTGDAPVTFILLGPGSAVRRDVPAGGEGSEIVRLPLGGGTITVTAPGMDDVVRSFQLACAAAEVASEVQERPAEVVPAPRAVVAPARSQATPPTVPTTAPAAAPAELPRTGADGTATLLRLSFTLLLFGLVLTGAPVVGRRRAAGRSTP